MEAWGQAAPSAQSPDALIAQGLEARRASDDARALGLFERAHAIDHAPRSLAQMALAEHALGRWQSADAHLREALAATGDPWIVSHRETLSASLDAIGRHLGMLDVATTAPHAELFLNGERVGALPLSQPVRVPSGSAQITVRAPGFHDAERTVDVTAGTLSREAFVLAPITRTAGPDGTSGGAEGAMNPGGQQANPGVPPAPPTGNHTGGGLPVGAIAVGGAGVVAFALSGVFYGLRQSALGSCQVESDAIHCPTAMSAMNAQGAGGFNTATDVALVAGGVLLAGGVAWFIVDRVTHHDERRAGLRVAPLADGAWVGFGGAL